jgi:hypothetical protein
MFHPARKTGVLLQSAAAGFLLLAGAVCLIFAIQLPVGSGFVLLSLAGLLLLAPLPLLFYRIYALISSSYTLERNGLRLRWGLHAEDIPIHAIEWMRPASDLVLPLPLPRLSWSGALLGSVHVADLGVVEFFASNRQALLLIATSVRIYAISPADPSAFQKAFYRTIELGSIETIPARSARPAAALRSVWHDRPARILVAVGAFLSLLVFLAVGLGIGSREMVSLGFSPDRRPLEPVPAGQALLLPFLAGSSFTLDFLLGLFFYHRAGRRPLAYALWVGGLLTPFIFLIAAWFIL